MKLLEKIVALENEAADFGFQWENTTQIMEQIESECLEIKEHLDDESATLLLQEEIGDLMHAVLSLCVFCKLDPLETLQKTTDKFERRLTAVKEISRDQGLETLKGLSFERLMEIWKEAKKV